MRFPTYTVKVTLEGVSPFTAETGLWSGAGSFTKRVIKRDTVSGWPDLWASVVSGST